MAVYAITISANYTDGPTSSIFYNSATARYYADEGCSKAIRSVAPLSRECWRFDGLWSATGGGVLYADENGKLDGAFLEKVWNGAGTIYAHWTRVSYKVTIDTGSGSGGVPAIYKQIGTGDVYTDDLCEGELADRVEMPTLAGSTCRGLGASSWSASTAIVDQDGYITDYFRGLSVTADTKRYASYLADYVATLNSKGGWGGTETISFDRVRSSFKVSRIDLPEREGFHFLGYFSAATGGTLRIDADGNVADDFVPTASVTLYAQWDRFLFKVTVSRGNGTGGDGSFYYNQDDDKFYADAEYTRELEALDLPFYQYFRCLGLYATNETTGELYIDADGRPTEALKTAARSFSDNVTVYAQYTRLCWLITISGSGTYADGKTFYGKVDGGLFADVRCTVPKTSLTIPEYELNRFTGIRASNNDTSALYVNPDGTFTDDFKAKTWTAATTVYARFAVVSIKITISANSGTFSPRAALYYKKDGGGVYAYWTCEGEPATSIPLPTRPGYGFTGVRESNNDTSVIDIDANGRLSDTFKAITLTQAKTIYARWVEAIKITLSAGGVAYYDATNDRFTDANGVVGGAIEIPKNPGFRFAGYFTADGALAIDDDGSFAPGFKPTAATSLSARWTDFAYPVTIENSGDAFEHPVFYYRVGDGGFFIDASCSTPIEAFDVPDRPGYTFAGIWSAASGGTLYVRETGELTSAFRSIEPGAALSIYARWIAKTYRLSFDYNGGNGSTSYKTVTFGQPIGTIPTATKPGNQFVGWYVIGSSISASSVWSFDGDAVAVAKWANEVGDVTDYFGFGSEALIPISSTDGANKKRICVAHNGKFERNVTAEGGVWRNPSVTYRVVRDVTFNATLGRAWAKGGSTVSGFMLTDVKVKTMIGEFPTVTVSAAANEGANAINLFPVSIAIKAAPHAQNLLSAIVGGGELQSCSLRAACEPVVVAENLMPCASDVVNGRIDVSAETIASSGESAPSASNGFASTGEPKSENEGEYTTWSIRVEREIN